MAPFSAQCLIHQPADCLVLALRDALFADGEAQRFVSIYDQYIKAPDVTRRRLFLETMESVLKNSNKVIIDDKQGVVPYLPLNDLNRSVNPAPLSQTQEVK